jgi:hypothetical protein
MRGSERRWKQQEKKMREEYMYGRGLFLFDVVGGVYDNSGGDDLW